MFGLKQSTARTVSFFAHDANGDGVTGLLDAGFTKRIRKDSATFAAMTVTITELENGWYSLALTAAHTDTLGFLTIVLIHASAKQVNLQFDVQERIIDDLAFPTVKGHSLDVSATGAAAINWANVENPGSVVNLGNTTVNELTNKTGFALSAASVDAILDEAINEPTVVFTWPASLRSIVGWLGALSRNKLQQTTTQQLLRNDADNATIATAPISDVSMTFTRGEFS